MYTFGNPVFPDALAEVPAARAAAESLGLTVVGLHWLFARTEGLHVHHPETPGPEKIARESLAHLRKVWGHG